jgi:hypothetical protein
MFRPDGRSELEATPSIRPVGRKLGLVAKEYWQSVQDSEPKVPAQRSEFRPVGRKDDRSEPRGNKLGSANRPQATGSLAAIRYSTEPPEG